MWVSGDIGHWVKRGICHGSVTCGFCGGESLDLVHGVVCLLVSVSEGAEVLEREWSGVSSGFDEWHGSGKRE